MKRSRFGILQSVGLSNKQFHKILYIEVMFYIMKILMMALMVVMMGSILFVGFVKMGAGYGVHMCGIV